MGMYIEDVCTGIVCDFCHRRETWDGMEIDAALCRMVLGHWTVLNISAETPEYKLACYTGKCQKALAEWMLEHVWYFGEGGHEPV